MPPLYHNTPTIVQAVAPGMIERRKGKIAVMASVNSYYVSPFNGPYSVSSFVIPLFILCILCGQVKAVLTIIDCLQ